MAPKKKTTLFKGLELLKKKGLPKIKPMNDRGIHGSPTKKRK